MSIRVERIRFNFLFVGFWNRAKMVFLTYKFKKRMFSASFFNFEANYNITKLLRRGRFVNT